MPTINATLVLDDERASASLVIQIDGESTYVADDVEPSTVVDVLDGLSIDDASGEKLRAAAGRTVEQLQARVTATRSDLQAHEAALSRWQDVLPASAPAKSAASRQE